MAFPNKTTWLTCAVICLALMLGACGDDDQLIEPPMDPAPAGDDGGGSEINPNGRVLGTLMVADVSPARGLSLELEPNDTLDSAQSLGAIRPGESVRVRGFSDAAEGADPFDGYEFVAPERVRLSVTLNFETRRGARLEVGLFDPLSLQLIETVVATSSPMTVEWYARGPFQVVVAAVQGEANYLLSLHATHPDDALPLRARGDDGSPAPFYGQIRPGESLTFRGSSVDELDATHALLVGLPVACRVEAILSAPPGGSVGFFDASTDLLEPVPLAVAAGDAGSVDVDGRTLLHVRATTGAGSGPWSLLLRATASEPIARRKPTLTGLNRLAPVQAESSRWSRAPSGVLYGRPCRDFVPGEVLVGFSGPERTNAVLQVALRTGQVREVRSSAAFACVRLDLAAGQDRETLARETLAHVASLKGSPGIAYAEPNYYYKAFAEPNDQHYPRQWSYPLLSLPSAWDITTGSSAVTVAVIDTGRTNHPDLAGRQSGGYDFISDSANAGDGDGRDADPTDVGDGGTLGQSSWHGTHVAGTIGAATNNTTGVAGCTWQTNIMHLRVLGRFGGTVSDISEAIRYAGRLSNASGSLPPQRAHVINMSLGGGGYSQTMQNAVTAARNAGVVIFAAAGNESSNSPSYPAAYSGVNSVSAVDVNADSAYYTNFGPTIDFAAPGGDTSVDRDGDGYVDGILSTLWDDGQPVYAFYQGTSMACPHAAGVAALLFAVNPTLTPDQCESLLASTAQDLGAPGRDDVFGHGLINAYAAVQAAQGAGTGPTRLLLTPPSLSFGNLLGELSVDVRNLGSGLLQVSNVTPTTDGGGSWLTATTTGLGDATRNVDGIRVVVDRSGLTSGIYTGRVAVTSNGGNAVIEVTIGVLIVPPLPGDTPIIVQLRPFFLDPLGTASHETVVSVADGLAFEFTDVPPGRYYVVAGTDLDQDRSIADEGEWFGEYPVLGDRAQVLVGAFADVEGVDFLIRPLQLISRVGSGQPRPAGAASPPPRGPVLLETR